MSSGSSAGPKFDDRLKVFFIVLCVLLAAPGAILCGLLLIDPSGHKSVLPLFPTFLCILPLMVKQAMPRWQLTAEGVLDLRKWKKKQLIADYADIRQVRLIEGKQGSAMTFEVETGSGSKQIGVRRGGEFLSALTPHLNAGTVVPIF